MYELDRPVTCSIARAMEILGERWTFLILRESFYGVRRFSDIQRNLGIARNILSTRLQSLVAAGEGLAVLPRFTSGGEGSGIVLRPLASALPLGRREVHHLRRRARRRPNDLLERAADGVEHFCHCSTRLGAPLPPLGGFATHTGLAPPSSQAGH